MRVKDMDLNDQSVYKCNEFVCLGGQWDIDIFEVVWTGITIIILE